MLGKLLHLSGADGSLIRAMDPTVIILLGIPIALVGVIAFYLFRHRKPRTEEAIYFRCPSCGRKLKYFARQAGHRGMCAGCKGLLVFPKPMRAHP